MAKRCLIVTYYFPPTGGGGVQRNVKLIKYLSRKNWKFTVVTSNGNDTNLSLDESLKSDLPEEVEVVKIANSDGKANSRFSALIKSTFLVRFISSFLFVPDRHKKWIKSAKKKIVEIIDSKKIDLILISSPPYSLVMLASELTREQSIPVVLDMRDPWTTNPYKIYPSSWHFKQDSKIETENIKQIKYGISAYKSLLGFYEESVEDFKTNNWQYIPNGYDEEDFKSLIPQKFEDNKFHIAFSGTFYSHINKPMFLLKGIAAVEKPLRDKICFHHIGDSAINLKKIARRYGLENNIIEWGYQDHNSCLNILAGMDALCFILDSSNKNSDKTIGGKVYEYLRLEKPILALTPLKGESATIINETNAGIVIKPTDHKQIAKTVTSMASSPEKNKSNKNITIFERSNLAKQYYEFFNQTLSENIK
ncbi:MAG: glycosyltransferase [Calditrichaeota bacterium]|nr:MAG: glycosyltransferase [Calditrichota bacterium]MBL1205774.1 glycosyltransferase [Calditrichota bacterium]NOG45602.1 glycosyltransferase [Calditrichota bacterium]